MSNIKGSLQHSIPIYARFKPNLTDKQQSYSIHEKNEKNTVTFNLPKDQKNQFVNNTKNVANFTFKKVFNQDTKQDEIFDQVATEIIDSVLEGYNGTIFAYGQTGSGKTYSITGGDKKYTDRGIIPRTISYIYDVILKKIETNYSIQISYIEIYNEVIYDLLDTKSNITEMEDLNRVLLYEDSKKNINLKNLNILNVKTEDDALLLLFTGETNRVTAETPMNNASTRSHCIFTIYLTAEDLESNSVIRKSKLHIVDLAGSERVAKSGIEGNLLTEAKYINLSLHYLEQVIISLAEKNRHHIPYRNSMMTSVLRDSLGGNCMTAMLTTIASDACHLNETISSCKFAQRVALIKNDVSIIEQVDPTVEISRLQIENKRLHDQILFLNGDVDIFEDLSLEDEERCNDLIKVIINDPSAIKSLEFGKKLKLIIRIVQLLAMEVKNKNANIKNKDKEDNNSTVDSKKLNYFKRILMQRDTEITILVEMLNKYKESETLKNDEIASIQNLNNEDKIKNTCKIDSKKKSNIPMEKKKILFCEFCRYNEDFQEMNLKKDKLKSLIVEAKQEGNELKCAETDLKEINQKLIENRTKILISQTDKPQNLEKLNKMEENYRRRQIDAKAVFDQSYNNLKKLKSKVLYLQSVLKLDKQKLESNFENWLNDKYLNSNQHSSKYDTPLEPKMDQIDLTGNEDADKAIRDFISTRNKLMHR